jgi:hypothetical protein
MNCPLWRSSGWFESARSKNCRSPGSGLKPKVYVDCACFAVRSCQENEKDFESGDRPAY